MYKLILENKILKEFIKDNPDLPIPIFQGLSSIKKLIKSDDDNRKVIDIIKRNYSATQQDIVNDFNNALIGKSFTISKSHENRQWRKAETYLKGQLEEIDGVAKVIDVSKQDRGYDFEMICSSGEKYYVEAKKVSSLDDSFTMTDRERSFASNEKYKYIIAFSNVRLSNCIWMH